MELVHSANFNKIHSSRYAERAASGFSELIATTRDVESRGTTPLDATRAAQLGISQVIQNLHSHDLDVQLHATESLQGAMLVAAWSLSDSRATSVGVRTAALCATAGLLLAADAQPLSNVGVKAGLEDLASAATDAAERLETECVTPGMPPGAQPWLLAVCCGTAAALITSTNAARRRGLSAVRAAPACVAVCIAQHLAQLAHPIAGPLPLQPHIAAAQLGLAACINLATNVQALTRLLEPVELVALALLVPDKVPGTLIAMSDPRRRSAVQAAAVPVLRQLLDRAVALCNPPPLAAASLAAPFGRLLATLPPFERLAKRQRPHITSSAQHGNSLLPFAARVAHAASYVYDAPASAHALPAFAPLLSSLLSILAPFPESPRLLLSAPVLCCQYVTTGVQTATPTSAAFLLLLSVPCLLTLATSEDAAQAREEWQWLGEHAVPAAIDLLHTAVADVHARAAATDFVTAIAQHDPPEAPWLMGACRDVTVALLRAFPETEGKKELFGSLVSLAAACRSATVVLPCLHEVGSAAAEWLPGSERGPAGARGEEGQHCALELMEVLLAMTLHAPLGALDDALRMLGTLWRRVPQGGRASVARSVRAQLEGCHHAAKKPRCVRWYHAQLAQLTPPAL